MIEREARVICDDCGLIYGTGTNSSRELRQEVKKMGWVWEHTNWDFCPECVPNFKLGEKNERQNDR